jgi:pyridoxine/pyridoxamine 5'-phosphate oxidase
MGSDEKLISKKQRFQEEDEEPSPKHWLFFQQFLDAVESWTEFKFVITTRTNILMSLLIKWLKVKQARIF